jgi:hypothetical protein
MKLTDVICAVMDRNQKMMLHRVAIEEVVGRGYPQLLELPRKEKPS